MAILAGCTQPPAAPPGGAAAAAGTPTAAATGAQTPAAPTPVPPAVLVLFENVRVFNGTSATLSDAVNVLVTGTTIAQISAATIPLPAGGKVGTATSVCRTSAHGALAASPRAASCSVFVLHPRYWSTDMNG